MLAAYLRRTKLLFTASPILLTVGACSQTPAPTPDLAAAAAEIREASQNLVSAEERGDFDVVMDFYAADAVVQAANVPEVRGTEAIRALYDEFFSGLTIEEMTSTTTDVRVATSGDMAWEYGVNRLVLTTPGGSVTDMGKYLLVWIREDGRWKVAALAFSSDAPPVS